MKRLSKMSLQNELKEFRYCEIMYVYLSANRPGIKLNLNDFLPSQSGFDIKNFRI